MQRSFKLKREQEAENMRAKMAKKQELIMLKQTREKILLMERELREEYGEELDHITGHINSKNIEKGIKTSEMQRN